MSGTLDPIEPLVLPTATEQATQGKIASRKIVAGKRLILDLLLLAFWILATDLLIYQIGTFLTWAVFFAGAVCFLAIVKQSKSHRLASCMAALLLMLIAMKLVWCGSWLQVGCGCMLVFCYAMALAGLPPFLPELLGFFAFVLIGAAQRMARFRIGRTHPTTQNARVDSVLQYLLPTSIVSVFGAIFVLANPEVANSVTLSLMNLWEALGNFAARIRVSQSFFWLASGWLVLGLIYPSTLLLMRERAPKELTQDSGPASIFPALRNTLVSVIALFGGYLAFEFSTLWLRTFPKDFYYAGYAHQGAFWLTLALALATVLLSVFFRGNMLRDPRLNQLQRLALIWSIENLLLSAAVYHRLFIYIDFNGMTRMRIVGLLGISCVIAGFLLVVFKLARSKGFVWLIHRQLWVPALAVVSYAILPVDWIVNRYNVAHVVAGNPAPVVQIIAHRTSAEGLLPLTDLTEVQDEKIREGVRALLALWANELGLTDHSSSATPVQGNSEAGAWHSKYGHASPWLSADANFSKLDRTSATSWHNAQAAETLLRNRLIELQPKWIEYANSPSRRSAALNQFFEYAYQWY